MTPDERQLLTQFLQDLAQARTGPKDPEAAGLIAQALNANPDGPYLLVQHAVLADQALHAAQGRIAELEAQLANAGQSAPSSFFGGGAPWGRASTAVPPSAPPQPQPAYAPAFGQGGGPFSSGGGLGSFLRNVGTTAAGVAGGEMLFEGLSGLFGGHRGIFGGFGGGFGGGYPTEEVVVNNYYDDAGAGGDWDNGGGFDDGSGNY